MSKKSAHSSPRPEIVGRRAFLKLAGVSAATGGMALGATQAAAVDASDVENGSGYRETDHVKTYYQLARF